MVISMDLTDYQILEHLSRDARSTYNSIAEKIEKDYHGASIRKRVLKLVRKKIIQRFTIVVDSDSIGFKTSIMFLEVNPAFVDNIVEKIKNYKEVTELSYSLDGKIIGVIKTKKEESLIKVIKEINAMSKALTNSVKEIKIITGLTTVKHNTFPI